MKREKITRFVKPEDANRQWYIIDAKDMVLGRLASKVARIIRGKDKAVFTPNMDAGDFVIVINAAQVKVTGKRDQQKSYFHYSGYPGGLKEKAYKELIVTKPEFVIESAVHGMLPKTRLGRKLMKKLKVYRDANHTHAAQKPVVLDISAEKA